jgi:hypothetical protein
VGCLLPCLQCWHQHHARIDILQLPLAHKLWHSVMLSVPLCPALHSKEDSQVSPAKLEQEFWRW